MGAGDKKNEGGGGFSAWGKSWDFGAIGGAKEEKKEETSEFGTNNPWGFGGAKTKKKTTSSNFDFGDFGASGDNDLSFGGTDNVPDTKADDAWGFGGTGKKDKKKKGGIEEIKEEPAPEPEQKEEESWGGWGGAKKTSKTKKKDTFDDAFAVGTTTTDTADASFDWGFGSSKEKKKELTGEVESKPANDEGGDDWMSGAWGTGKKKTKKKADDLSASIDLGSNADSKAADEPPADDGWGAFSTKKDKKKTKKSLLDDEPPPPPEVPEPPPAAGHEPIIEPLVAWDFGLNTKEKKKKEKTMKLDGSWDDRITQEMVDSAEAEAAAAIETAEAEPEPVPDLEPEIVILEEKVPWDHGLTAKDRRKKMKDMQLDGSWEDRLTQEKIDEERVAAEAAAAFTIEPEFEPESAIEVIVDDAPLEDLVPWDYMLTSKEKKKKEKDLRANGEWEDRLTQEKIDQMIADRDNVAIIGDFEPDPILEPELEGEREPEIPPEDLRPWDDGLSPKEKKRKEKEMKSDGTWEDRLTQEIIDEKIAAKAYDYADPVPEAQPEEHQGGSGESLEELEQLEAWDHNLSAKEKKRKEKQMKLDGTWEDRLTQEAIDDKIADAKAAAPVQDEPEAIPDPIPEPEPEPLFEERLPWDHGLSKIEKKRKEKQMKLEGSWEDRLTQEQIDSDAAAAAAINETEPDPIPPPPPAEPEPDAEPRLAWDHGLLLKDKKKKEKQMKLDGTWNDRVTQEQIDEEAAAKAAAKEAGPDPIAGDSWGFGWAAGNSKGKPKDKSLLDPEPEKVEEKTEDTWGGSWGFGKKKKDKTPEPEPEPEPEPIKEEKVDDIWSFGTTTKDKKKKDKGAKKSDMFDTLVEEPPPPPPEAIPKAEEDMLATFTSKTDKKSTKKSKKIVEELPPPVPSPPALGLTPEPEAEIPSVDDFSWGGLDTGRKSNKSLAEEAPAKKSSGSIWGFGSSSSASKTKKEKEANAKKEAEEQAAQAEAERQQREAEEADRLAAEEAAKSAKKTKTGKSSKAATAKVEEKKKSADLFDLLDEPAPTPASSSSKLKKTSTHSSDKKLDDVAEEEDKNATTDYFSFWGASGNKKKTPGEKSTSSKKEIKSSVLTNDEDALLAELNEDEIQAILEDAPAPSSPKLTKTMSNGKSKTTSRLADRIKAFEPSKEDAGKKSKSALINEEAEVEVALDPKEAKKVAKGKAAIKSSKTQVDQPPSPPVINTDKKKSKDFVPGGFPMGDDDDLLGEDVAAEIAEKPNIKKSSKVEKKSTIKSSTTKKKKSEPVTFEETDPVDELDLLGGPTKLPTPPPEEKTAKKERAKVERSNTGSWGFWSASAPPPKKPVRSKTLDDTSPPASSEKAPAGLSRTKSTKSAKKQEPADKEVLSKSSGSDKEGSGKRADRPKPSRGLSLSGFMLGGAPPSAMRNAPALRRSSTTGSRSSSRRQSMVDSGLVSPPDEEGPITSKAAKLMGFGAAPKRRSSTKEKSKAYVDPYPIDDDDMVMINTREGAEPTPKKSKPKVVTSAKKSATKPRSKTISGDEEVVMVDSPIAIDSANDDFEKPLLQRSNTGKRSLFGSLFGGAAKVLPDRTRSMTLTDHEDNTVPVQSRGTSRRRSQVMSPADGFTTDAPLETDAELARKSERRSKKVADARAGEDERRQEREQKRRERREREKADIEARRERAREQARKEREAEEQKKEERRARRRAKEAAERERLAQEEAEADAAAERRKEERRRLREKLEAENGINPLSKDERRRTYAEGETKRGKEKSRSKQSSARSTALMAEYHESRSGSGRGIKPPENKTSSWIDSQKDEPPDLPPVEATVLDESGQVPRPVADGDSRRRRKDKYAGMTQDEIDAARSKRRERRIVEKSTSGGSDEKVQKQTSKRVSRVYDEEVFPEPVKTFDGRPQTSKRSSFLGKFF